MFNKKTTGQEIGVSVDVVLKSIMVDRKHLRTVFQEEIEKQDEKHREKLKDWLEDSSLGEEQEEEKNEKLISSFKEDFAAFLNSWCLKNIITPGDSDSIHDFLYQLGEQSVRNVEARLHAEGKDGLSEVVENHFWHFSDIVMLDDKFIQRVLRESDQQTLAMALKGVDFKVLSKITSNMSRRGAAMLKEDIEFLGPVRLVDVFAAQKQISDLIRKLENGGDICIDAHDELDDD